MEIVVLGGGPAGVACATGLSRMGYGVRLITTPRRFESFEGISQRVHQALIDAGLRKAANTVSPARVRQVIWGSQPTQLNSELLVDRQKFDLALLDDAVSHGVSVIRGRVTNVDYSNHGHIVTCDVDGLKTTYAASFVVEARGRQASHGRDKISGPTSISLLAYWRTPAIVRTSIIESLDKGWLWATSIYGGRLYTQLSLGVGGDDAKGLMEPAAYLGFLKEKTQTFEKHCTGQLISVSPVYARGGTALCALKTGGANWVRVGDAAMAVDSLSGNGIFQALSTSLQAPAVINTLITRPKHAAVALDFHQKRVHHLFERFARVGRDFYKLGQNAHPGHGYWDQRACWPDDIQLNASVNFDSLQVVDAAVIDHGIVRSARVVTSPEQPLGMWHLAGLELAPRVQRLFQGENVHSVTADLSADASARFKAWLRSQGYESHGS